MRQYKGFTYTPAPKTAWDSLSMLEKSEMMKVAVRNGITNLNVIREKYNEFAKGGNLYAGTSTDDDLVDWIIREEGFLAKPKDIGDGKITLGSGLTAQKWHDLYKKRGNKWTETDNRKAVAEEVANRRKWAESNIPNWDTLPSSSQKALLSYKYNYDFNASNSPKLFKALKDSNLYEAARQMDATSKDPKFRKGLQARRQREQNWFLSGVKLPQIPYSEEPIVEVPVSTYVSRPYISQTVPVPAFKPEAPNEHIAALSLNTKDTLSPKDNMEGLRNFNWLMQLSGVRNPLDMFLPKESLPYLYGTFSTGGSIHIKPENRGKFTALKERTGHSATWFKEHGTPAQKKMAIFDLNSRHWNHHALGGYLKGAVYDLPEEEIKRLIDSGYEIEYL